MHLFSLVKGILLYQKKKKKEEERDRKSTIVGAFILPETFCMHITVCVYLLFVDLLSVCV